MNGRLIDPSTRNVLVSALVTFDDDGKGKIHAAVRENYPVGPNEFLLLELDDGRTFRVTILTTTTGSFSRRGGALRPDTDGETTFAVIG